MQQLTVRLPEDAYALLRAESDRTGIPPAILARSWILENLRRTSSFFDLPVSAPGSRPGGGPSGPEFDIMTDPSPQAVALRKRVGLEE